jgi:hypothetical protein
LGSKIIPQKYFTNLSTYLPEENNVISFCCACNETIIMLAKDRIPLIKPEIVIVNKKNQVLYQKSIENKNYFNIAVSFQGSMYATIYSQTIPVIRGSSKKVSHQHIVTITDIIENKTTNITLPIGFKLFHEHPTVAFNKQNAAFIIHGQYLNQKNLTKSEPNLIPPHHIIIPLPTSIAKPGNKKMFAEYFLHQRICQNFMQQLTLEK